MKNKTKTKTKKTKEQKLLLFKGFGLTNFGNSTHYIEEMMFVELINIPNPTSYYKYEKFS